MEFSYPFMKSFKRFFLLSNLNSIHIPGIEFPVFRVNLFYIYCHFFNFGSILMTVDMWSVLYFTPSLPIEMFFVVLFPALTIIMNDIQRLTFIFKREKMSQIMEALSDCMVVPLWPKSFEKIFAARCVIPKWIYMVYVIAILIPMITVEKVFISRTLLCPSILLEDVAENLYGEKIPAPRGVIVYQMLFMLIGTTSWMVGEAMLVVLYKAVIAQLDYLNVTLKDIIDVIYVAEDGTIFHGDGRSRKILNEIERKSVMNLMRKRLRLWVDYQVQVIRTYHKVRDFVEPIASAQFMFFVGTFCGIFFIAISGFFRDDMFGLSLIFCVTRMSTTYHLCRCGDVIAELGAEIGRSGVTPNYIGCDTDIQKKLLFIGEMARRELIGKSRSFLPINSGTFMDMVILQYRFFTFMRNMTQFRK